MSSSIVPTSIAALLVQLSIFVLALYKQRRFHRLQRPPLVIFVIRECSIVALTISGMFFPTLQPRPKFIDNVPPISKSDTNRGVRVRFT